MLSLNQEIAKRIHNAQIDNRGDVSVKGTIKGFFLYFLDGLVDICLIFGAMAWAITVATNIKTILKKKKG